MKKRPSKIREYQGMGDHRKKDEEIDPILFAGYERREAKGTPPKHSKAEEKGARKR